MSLYGDLDPAKREIRVVSIIGDGMDENEPVRCTLTVQSLDDTVFRFNALSYCWGSLNTTEIIYINDVEMQVTENLAYALHHFRVTGDGAQLWIDYICIDQQNVTERNSQVAMMGDIYKRTETVHIWLGGSSLVDKASMRALKDLSAVLKTSWNTSDPDVVAALEWLAKNPYWKRTWILQEASFSMDIVVHGNGERVSLEIGKGFGHPFVSMRDRLLTAPQYKERLRAVAEIFEPMAMAAWSSAVSSLVAAGDPAFLRVPQVLFTRFRHSLASDPRDKIYGMLNLLPSVFENIYPDYSKTMQQIFEEATLGLMQGANDLEVLCQACSGSDELPSWVPDFRVPSRIPKYMTDYWITCRAGFLIPTNVSLKEPGLLQVKAFPVDRITHVARGGSSDPPREPHELWKPLHRWRYLFDEYAEKRVQESYDNDYVFWRAVCGGGVEGVVFEEEHKIACQKLMINTGGDIPDLGLELLEDQDFVNYLTRVSLNHDFFITKDGHAGLAFKDTIDKDDEIYIFARATVPFCVRKLQTDGKQAYQLRTPCFVETHRTTPGNVTDDNRIGIMDGGVILAHTGCTADDKDAMTQMLRDVLIA